jgi:hypothetical protein
MKRILKYPLKCIDSPYVISFPSDSEILHVGQQDGQIMVWCLVGGDHTDPGKSYEFRTITTGENFDDAGLTYVGTVHVDWFVAHIWYKLRD